MHTGLDDVVNREAYPCEKERSEGEDENFHRPREVDAVVRSDNAIEVVVGIRVALVDPWIEPVESNRVRNSVAADPHPLAVALKVLKYIAIPRSHSSMASGNLVHGKVAYNLVPQEREEKLCILSR